MSAPESFIEQVRCQLVLIRRNTQRAWQSQIDLRPHEAADSLDAAREQIAALEADINAAAEREVHTCSCGHTHYLHGDDA